MKRFPFVIEAAGVACGIIATLIGKLTHTQGLAITGILAVIVFTVALIATATYLGRAQFRTSQISMMAGITLTVIGFITYCIEGSESTAIFSPIILGYIGGGILIASILALISGSRRSAD